MRAVYDAYRIVPPSGAPFDAAEVRDLLDEEPAAVRTTFDGQPSHLVCDDEEEADAIRELLAAEPSQPAPPGGVVTVTPGGIWVYQECAGPALARLRAFVERVLALRRCEVRDLEGRLLVPRGSRDLDVLFEP